MTNLAHVLGLAVIAEGVETRAQSDEVNAIGCEYVQGYFYARPMPASAIGARLDSCTRSVRSRPFPVNRLLETQRRPA